MGGFLSKLHTMSDGYRGLKAILHQVLTCLIKYVTRANRHSLKMESKMYHLFASSDSSMPRASKMFKHVYPKHTGMHDTSFLEIRTAVIIFFISLRSVMCQKDHGLLRNF